MARSSEPSWNPLNPSRYAAAPPALFSPLSAGSGLPVKYPLTQPVSCHIEAISWSPRVFLIHEFLTDDECDHIITKASPYMTRSTVSMRETGDSLASEVRTSTGMFLTEDKKDDVIRRVELRIAQLTQLPPQNGEAIHVLNYQPGQEYKPHFDFFDPTVPGYEKILGRGGQRTATVIMYLKTPIRGGETMFPNIDLKVPAVRRNAVLFYNTLPDSTVDPKSLHGGCVVEEGEKWTATRWIREHAFS